LEDKRLSEKSRNFGQPFEEVIGAMNPKYNTDATARVKRHIMKLRANEPFATRDLLSYGKRDTVDKALQRMVKKGWILRLARGVFVKPPRDGSGLKLPSLMQIAWTKAKAFGKELFVHGGKAAHKLQLLPPPPEQPTFIATGHSTSFRCTCLEFKETRIHFKSTAPRAVKLADTAAGQVIRAFRHIGARQLDYSMWRKVRSKLDRSQSNELDDAIKWMPTWMSDVYWRTQAEFERTRVKIRRAVVAEASARSAFNN
jgi:hypothetical protein